VTPPPLAAEIRFSLGALQIVVSKNRKLPLISAATRSWEKPKEPVCGSWSARTLRGHPSWRADPGRDRSHPL